MVEDYIQPPKRKVKPVRSLSEYKPQIMEHKKKWDSMQKCTGCNLPESFRFMEFRDDSCNYCDAHLEVEGYTKDHALEHELAEILDDNRGLPGSEYDCILGFSGGKDSSYTLHMLREKYNMNVLALTIQNGFLPEVAQENVAQAVEKLGVDHMWINAPDEVKDIYKELFKINSEHGSEYDVCGTCGEVLRKVLTEVAIDKKIPLMVTALDHFQLIDWDIYDMEGIQDKLSYWNGHLKEKGLFKDFFEVKNFDPKGFVPQELFPFMYLPYDAKVASDTVLKYGITKNTNVDETNCRMTYIMDVLDIFQRDSSAFAFLESSAMRLGKCTKEEADAVADDVFTEYARGEFDDIVFETLDKMGLTLEELFEARNIKA